MRNPFWWCFGLHLTLSLVATAKGDESTRGKVSQLNRVVVTPNGPEDGGDFGPKTPGTKTSGLQEALDAAKREAKDVYLSGGSWTEGKTEPVVYFLHETLRVPWMQNFRLDSGHCVLHYSQKTGDAVHIDSQMSCCYRFGLIVSLSDGAAVRLRPESAGPDRFKVITSTEFHFNALVGGGGAWPGGEAYNSTLDKKRRWIGTGLALDASTGSIDGNKISVIEVVGCERGVYLKGPCTHNAIDVTIAHLCQNHVQIGDEEYPGVQSNRISAHMESEGIEESVGCRIFGHDNLFTLSSGRMSPDGDIVFEKSAHNNLITAHTLGNGFRNDATSATNRIINAAVGGYLKNPPMVPPSGEPVVNRFPWTMQIRILDPGVVQEWTETDSSGESHTYSGSLAAGEGILLNPGEKLALRYSQPPTWTWKSLPGP